MLIATRWVKVEPHKVALQSGPTYTEQIGDALRASSVGMTCAEIADALPPKKHGRATVAQLIRNVPDAYISGWRLHRYGRHIPEWSVGVSPDCPRPERLPYTPTRKRKTK